MKKNSGQQVASECGRRSQRSLLREKELCVTLARIEGLIGKTEREIDQHEREKRRLAHSAAQGLDPAKEQLSETVRRLVAAKEILESYKLEHVETELQIEKLQPTPAQCRERAEVWKRFGQRAGKRLQVVRAAEGARAQLRQALQDYSGLSAEMATDAEALEFAMPADGLDEQRFKALADSLPGDLLPVSEAWHRRFFGGQAEGSKPYIVRVGRLVLPETLNHSGVFAFGETVLLSDEDAAELQAADYSEPQADAPWRCASPSVMTPEAYEAAVKAAAEKGVSPQEVLFWQDAERDQQCKKQFFESGMTLSLKRPGRRVAIEVSQDTTVPIRVTAKIPLVVDRQYAAGETVGLTGVPSAWELVTVDAIEALQ